MEIRVLEYFLSLAREQSISAAAESMHLSQPTLSRQLHDMEKELGKQLFIRGNRKIILTEEGMILRKRAEEILELVQKTENEIMLSDQTIAGNVHIGTGESEGIRIFAKVGKKLQKDYPDIHLHVASGDSLELNERLEKGLIDFAILFEPADISSYESIMLPFKDRIGILMPANCELASKDSISFSDLNGLPLIVSRQHQKNGFFTPVMRTEDFHLNIIATYNLIFNASLMVEEGMGYAIGLDYIINTYKTKNLTFRPLSPTIEISLHLVWKKYQIFTKASQIFLDTLQDELKSNFTPNHQSQTLPLSYNW